jgi:hypothetical protein
MRPGVYTGGLGCHRVLCLIFISIFLFSSFPSNVAGENKEFETEKFQEKLTIPRNELQAIDFSFQDEELIEIVYKVQVKDELPVDVWFVNEDNYLLLSGGAQFLYFIDGSDSQIAYTKKIVPLTKHDNYKLVITNYYSNQTIEVDVVGEIRTYLEETEEPFWKTDIFIYALIIIIVILIILLVVLGFKIRKTKRADTKVPDKGPAKKAKDKKPKEEKHEPSKKKDKKSKGKAEKTEFCGNCGEPVDTPFCKNCGREV